MEGFIVLFVVAVFVLGIKWFVSYDKSNRRDNKSVTFKKHKLDKKQLEENDKKYKRWKEVTQTKFEKKSVRDDYYQSEEYKKFCEERAAKYDELVHEGTIAGEVEKIGGGIARKYTPLKDDQNEQVFYGERGGRYRIRYNKNGEPYRDYF